MRRRLLVPVLAACTCALLGAGILAASGYERAYDPERCAIESSDTTQTILTNDVGRIWLEEYYGKSDGARYRRYYACLNRSGRDVFLASSREAEFEGDEGHFRSYVTVVAKGLGGATVAFAKVTCADSSDARTCGSKLRVLRLDREGGEARPPISRRHALIGPPLLDYSGGPMYYTVEKPGTRFREIHRVSTKGRDRVIDRGTDIRLGSLTLAPNGDLFWRNGPEPRVYPPPK